MKILVVGAGALGGYFGGRLLAARRDVTFLVRAGRAAQLDRDGLVVTSPRGDLRLAQPPHLLAAELRAPFDLVMVGCKAYDLESTMESFAPAVGPDTAILPLLNGMRHLDVLAARFGQERVLGGVCQISATLDKEGAVHHLNDTDTLLFGDLAGPERLQRARVQAIADTFAEANFDGRASDDIVRDMWEKWVFIASAAGLTTLLRGTVGDIVEAGGGPLAGILLAECAAIASHNGYPPRGDALGRSGAVLSAAGSPVSASMLKDIERGAPIEADHIVGDLLRRAQYAAPAMSLLKIVYTHLKTYEARRARTAKANK